MRLDDAGDDVDAFGLQRARGFEHGIGLADAGRRAEEDLQPAAFPFRFFFADAGKQFVGIRTVMGHSHW